MTIQASGQFDGHASRARLESWEVTGADSALTFSLRHIVVREIIGHFRKWGALLVLDLDDVSRSWLTGWVDLASIDTGAPERDEHIRSPEFFNVSHVPVAEFRSNAIYPIDGQHVLVRGQLVLHGVEQPIDLTVTPGPTIGEGDSARATYEVQATIDRQAFGLHWNQDLDAGGLVVGDRIEIQARVRAKRVPNDPATMLAR
jgi:polyisoprenoid-binding protein YceI